MMSIWGFCLEICEYKIFERYTPKGVGRKLEFGLEKNLLRACEVVSRKYQENGYPFIDYRIEYSSYKNELGGIINFASHVILNFARTKRSGLKNTSEQLEEVLTKWAKNLLETRKEQGFVKWYFIQKAAGFTRDAESVCWNSENKHFDNVPWPLEKCCKVSLPGNAIKFWIDSNYNLVWLRQKSQDAGYQIIENREFSMSFPARKKFYKVMEIIDSNNSKAVLTIWQKKYDEQKTFFLVKEIKTSLKSIEIERRIELQKKMMELNFPEGVGR